MWQPVYDRNGIKCHLGCPFQYWNDACWHQAIPVDASGLTYLDVGCCNGLFPLRFSQSSGTAVGIDGVNGEIVDASKLENVGRPIEENIETFKILREEHQASYEGWIGGFNPKGTLYPINDIKFDIVSCMNTIEYIDDRLACLDSLKNKTKHRLIICTDITDGGTYTLPGTIRCTISNTQEIVDRVGWPCIEWRLNSQSERDFPHQGFFVFENPDSTLPPFNKTPPTFTMELTATQRYRSIPAATAAATSTTAAATATTTG